MEQLDKDILSTSSLIVFVAVTSILSISTIVTFDSFVKLMVEGQSGVWTGFGADNDDDGMKILWGMFKAQPNQNVVVQNLARVAFAIVLGPILHELSDEVLEFSKAWAVFGMSAYLFSLSIFFGRVNPVAWVIISEFFLLVWFGILLGGLTIRSLHRGEA